MKTRLRTAAVAAVLVWSTACAGGPSRSSLVPLSGISMQNGRLAHSVISPEVGSTLLYVSTGDLDGAIYIYTYPQGQLVSGLSLAGVSRGLCSDAAGDVFITNDYAVYVYPYGSGSPSATLTNPDGATVSCSVDPISGNLAAMTVSGDVALFRPWTRHGWHLPQMIAAFSKGVAVAYDGFGNLFAAGSTTSRGYHVAELAKGMPHFKPVTLDGKRIFPGDIQWDGKYVAIGDNGNVGIHRFKFKGTKGVQISVTRLKGAQGITQFWIEGKTLIAAAVGSAGFFAGLWTYPNGGDPRTEILGYHTQGVTVSARR